jgi:hypothetical protein
MRVALAVPDLDPFRYKWKFAQRIEDVSRDEVHRRATGGPEA